MRKKQKSLSFFMVIIMLLSLISTMPVKAEYDTNPMTEDGTGESVSAAELKIGDYVQMGSYYDDPILWRCVDIDENGPLMLSDRILCLKPWDAPGRNVSGSHGRYQGREQVGSNYWKDSNIRLWLNSGAAAGDIVWSCGNPPSEENVEYNAYADEAGFLHAFTVLEKGVIKSVTQKSLLAAADKDVAGAKGSAFHKYNDTIYSVSDGKLVYKSILENYDEAYYEEVEDSVFLLDVKQIQNVFNNTPKLGTWYHIGKLTEKAVENSDYKDSLIQAGSDWYNWLRSPYVNDEGNQGSVRHVSRNGQVGCSVIQSNSIGVRPAFYIKENTVFPTGDGSVDTPYLLTHTHTLTHYDGVAATCTKPGTGEYWKCEGTGSCGKMFSDKNGTVEIIAVPAMEAKGHKYGNWEITTVPTMEAKGEAVRVCQNDETHKEIKELPILTDTDVWTVGERKAPTETETGSQQYTSEYGTVTVIIPAIGHIHKLTHHEVKAATCTKPGTGEYWKCEGTGSCGKLFSDENGTVEITAVPAGAEAKGHKYGNWEITTVPTMEAKGEAVRVCQNDETHKEIKELPILTNTDVWTAGERKAPTGTETGSQQYTSEFGTVTVIIPATGYEHPLPSEDEDKTDKEQQEKRELALNAKLKVSQVGKKINICWGRASEADGYHVYVQYCGMKFNDKSLNQVIGANNTSITVKKVNGKKLDLKKNYKVYVEAYKLSGGKKKILGKSIIAHIVGKNNQKYTNVKEVRVKKNSYTLKQGNTITIQANVVLVSRGKKQLSNAHARQFRYASSDKKIATVSKNGKVKAVGKGTCTVYVYARNGYAKAIKITVK
ncbi:MAG: Ig-like domain-containing protein [Lachnospira sp.]|nr:Ig-like domain-containing protein [Lachnospira sp.]